MADALPKTTNYQFKQPDRSADVPEGANPWVDDKLGRKDSAERLADMLAGQNGPLTIGLNAPWGEGKTFFLKRFQKTYEKQPACAVYFNAWQDDFLDDPLLSLLCQLRKAIDGLPQETLVDSVKQALVPTLKQVGLALAKNFVRNKMKIDLDELSTTDLATKSEKLFAEYATYSASKDELVKALGSLAKSIRDWSDKPLVVIVDELDRCRPTFAIETLERIKHLFAVKNIVFVLGIDRLQLESSIQSVYGDIDAQGYLQRFIDVEFSLPRGSLYGLLHEQLADSRIARAIDPNNGMQIVNAFFSAFCAIADAKRLPPRTVEHAIRKFALVACARDHESHSWAIVTAYAVGLSLLPDKNLFNRFMNGECEPKEVISAIFPDFDLSYPATNNEVGRMIRYLYRLYYHTHWDDRTKREFSEMLDRSRPSNNAVIDMRHLPSFAATNSPEDVYSFFRHIPDEGGFHINLKSLLSDLRETMSSIVDFAPVPFAEARQSGSGNDGT